MTAEPVRAFVAIRPPESVLDAIAARTARLVLPHGRLTTRDQWHVTLQFLGKADVDAVGDALTDIDVGAKEVRLSGAGSLPPERRSKYLVAYLFDADGWVFGLRDAVAERLLPLGFEPDHRDRGAQRLWPHLTLARLKAATRMEDLAAGVGSEPIGEPWTVDEIVVYESQLRSTGAEYAARARIPLA